MRRLVVSLAAVASLAVAVRAEAYCRTTTVAVPAGYDPVVSGCIPGGKPLSWPSMPVTYQLNEAASTQVSLADATAILDRSFAKWGAADCGATSSKWTTQPDVSFQNLGPTTAGYAVCDGGPCSSSPQDAPHLVLFRDQAWPYDDPSNTLALTTVTFGTETANIYAAQIEINSAQHRLSTTLPAPTGAFSLEAILTHEAGHFVGLAHSQQSTAIMYANYQPDAVALTPDDVSGVCVIYPPPTQSGCSCALARRAPVSAGILGTALLSAIAWARRRRARRLRAEVVPANFPEP